MTESCEKAGLLHVRVRAVDGTNSNDGCNDTVSIDDISLTWDSTVHSEYESSYPVNDSIAMTPTERACAASHLRTWRWIANIRQQLFQAPFPSSGRITADDMSLSLNDSSHLFASCNLGGGWSCINLDIDSNKDHHPSHLQTTGFGANDDWYLILEDDANIPTLPSHGYTQSDFRAKLSEIIHMYTPSDFDILYLGYSSSAACKMTNINKVVVKPSYLWSLHAYVLRGRAVNKLLSQLPIRAPVDKFIASLVLDGHLQAYALREKLVSLTETTRLSLPNVHHSGRVGNVRVRKYQNKPSTLTSKRKKK